jgi:hypothetical protein
MDFITLAHDWFFQINQYESQHQLVETCPGEESTLPCNAEKRCRYTPAEGSKNKPVQPPANSEGEKGSDPKKE